MTDDIRGLLDEAAAPPGPPSTVDSDRIVEAGRRRVRRRRIGVTGGSTTVAAVAALTAAVLVGPGSTIPFGAAGDPTTTDDGYVEIGPDVSEAPTVEPTSPQPMFPYPSIDQMPDWTYWWDIAAVDGPTEKTAPYTAALKDWAANAPYSIPTAEFERVERIVTGTGPNGEHELFGEPVPRYEAGFPVLTGDGLDINVTVEIWSAESFAPGEGTTFAHLYTCDEGVGDEKTGDEKVVARDCWYGDAGDESTVVVANDILGKGDFWTVTSRLVLYRPDGTAVVVTQTYPTADDALPDPDRLAVPVRDYGFLSNLPSTVVD